MLNTLSIHGQSNTLYMCNLYMVIHSTFSCYGSAYMVPIHQHFDYILQHYTVIESIPLIPADHACVCNIQNMCNFILE